MISFVFLSQKYLLQTHPTLVHALGLNGDGIIRSKIAARLNGYVGGYGLLDEFYKEWESFGLDDNELKEEIASLCKSGTNAACGIR